MTDTMSKDQLNALLQQIDSTLGYEVTFDGDKFKATNGFNKVSGIMGDPEHNAALANRVASELRYPPQPKAPVVGRERNFKGPVLTPAEKFEAMLEKIKRERDADSRNLLAVQRQEMYDLPTDVTYYPRWVGPEQAEAWLRTIGGVLVDGKPVQRAYSLPTAKRYADIMRENAWWLSPDPIVFEKPDPGDPEQIKRNLNGQHRLIAIIMTGMTLPFMISEGWVKEAFLTLDKNLKRSAASSLFLQGEKFSGPMSNAASLLVKAEVQPDITVWGNKGVRPDEAAIRHVVQTRPTLRECVAWARVGKPKWMNPNALAVARCLAAEACGKGPDEQGIIHGDLDATAKYFNSFKGGGGLNEGDPAYAMRHYLETQDGQGYIRRSQLLDPAGFQTFLILTGWNAEMNRERLSRPMYKADQLKIPKPLRPRDLPQPLFVPPSVRNPILRDFDITEG